MTFGLRKSEDVGLIVRAVSFQDFQPVVMIHQRHRQTDRRHAIARPQEVRTPGEACAPVTTPL